MGRPPPFHRSRLSEGDRSWAKECPLTAITRITAATMALLAWPAMACRDRLGLSNICRLPRIYHNTCFLHFHRCYHSQLLETITMCDSEPFLLQALEA